MDKSKLNKWYALSTELKLLRKEELKLRRELFFEFFKSPSEGVNSLILDDGYILKSNHNIIRKINHDKFEDIMSDLGDGSYEYLTTIKTNLNLCNYKGLSNDDKIVVDSALIVSIGSPTMEIVKKKL